MNVQIIQMQKTEITLSMKRPRLLLKLGGAVLEQRECMKSFFDDLKSLQAQGYDAVCVHGGGKQIDLWLQQLGMTISKKNGLRITPENQIPVITAVLAGITNKSLVAQAQHAGLQACGLAVCDAGILKTQVHADRELGCVGSVHAGNSDALNALLHVGITPIVCSIGAENGQLLNINADEAAAMLAQQLNAQALWLISDVPGVYDNNGEVLPELDDQLANRLVQNGVINHGMQVKVNAALAVARASGTRVHMGNAAGFRQFVHALNGRSDETFPSPSGTLITATKNETPQHEVSLS